LENTKENCEKIWKIWKKGKSNREKIWKIQKKIVKRYGKYAYRVVTYSPHKELCPLLQSYPFRYRIIPPYCRA
jgi:outer membrane protein assembly factor BamA